jgi:zinc transport system permease protein
MDNLLLQSMGVASAVALVAGPMGALVVWRHMAYFGDTIAHGALLGVAIALLSQTIPMPLAMFGVSLLVAFGLQWMSADQRFHHDTLLGMLAHATLAIGVLLVAVAGDIRVDLNAYLFGDLLTLNTAERGQLYAGMAALLVLILWQWRALVLCALDVPLAQLAGVNVRRTQAVFVLALAAFVALAMQLVGVLLITALLIIPAASARFWAHSPNQMAVLASIAGVAACTLGLHAAFIWNTPTAPTMVAMAAAGFILSAFLSKLRSR